MRLPPCPVSVILPIYNCQNTVVRAVRSILEQTRPPAEIICINDGSTDQTLETLNTYIAGHPLGDLVKIIDMPENGGVYVARNQGLQAAMQPYIAFQDADDFWHPRKLEIEYAAFEADQDLFFLTHNVEVWPEEQLICWHDVTPCSKQLSKVSKHRCLWFTRLHTISVMMKRSDRYIFDESKRRGGDMLMWLEIVLSNEKSRYLNETLSWKAKPHVGASGLSGNLWKAEMENQHTIEVLASKKLISRPYAFLKGWCMAKLLRRYFMVEARKLRKGLLWKKSWEEQPHAGIWRDTPETSAR